jgi:hypothetical protein
MTIILITDFYHKIRFALSEGGLMSWHAPLDLGFGGMILVDGELVSQSTE